MDGNHHLEKGSGSIDLVLPPSTSISIVPVKDAAQSSGSGHRHHQKLRSVSPASVVRSFRAASPSIQQPLTVNVDFPTSTGVLHPRRRLSKRCSFDSGINLHAGEHSKAAHERKDSLKIQQK